VIIKVACHISGRKLGVLWGKRKQAPDFVSGTILTKTKQNRTKQNQNQKRGKLIEASVLPVDKTVF